jgi:hypothetical protein
MKPNNLTSIEMESVHAIKFLPQHHPHHPASIHLDLFVVVDVRYNETISRRFSSLTEYSFVPYESFPSIFSRSSAFSPSNPPSLSTAQYPSSEAQAKTATGEPLFWRVHAFWPVRPVKSRLFSSHHEAPLPQRSDSGMSYLTLPYEAQKAVCKQW